jgi:hypothetical protein
MQTKIVFSINPVSPFFHGYSDERATPGKSPDF